MHCGGNVRGDVSVVFIDARMCRKLNRTYLGHDYSTDVMTFPLGDRRMLEGEIYINLDQARRQAQEYGATVGQEIARLVIHGTLHLIGYDDTRTSAARRMRKKEEEHMQYWFSRS